MLISIVIPAYNEAKRIAKTLEDINKFIANHSLTFEVIVINDGSRDKTLDLLNKINGIKILSYETNRGKGFALRTGVAAAQGDWIYICDADLASPISELDKFLELNTSFDCIIGSRAISGSQETQSQIRKLLGRVGNALINNFLGLNIADTQCGFKLFNKKAAQEFLNCKIERWGFDFEFLLRLRQANLKIKELPIVWDSQQDSKVTAASYLATTIELLKIWWNYIGFSWSFWTNLWSQNQRLIKYLIIGFGTVGLNLGAFILLRRLIQINETDLFLEKPIAIRSYQILEASATVVSTIFNFVGHKMWTFNSKQWQFGEMIRYCALLGFNFLVSVSIITFIVETTHVELNIAKIISIFAIISWNFFALRIFVYRNN